MSEPALRLWINQQVKRTFESHIPYTTKFELPGADGIQYFLVEIYPLTWYEHDSLAFVFSDISVESKQMQNLQNAAYTDKMTKLFNRLYGMQMLSKWMDEKTPFILCFTDMDNLKYVNDRFGHLEGDRYIVAVAEVLQKFTPEAILCRVGGDEFMLLAKHWSIENSGSAEGVLYNQSFSFGFTEVEADNSSTMSEILRTADERMYEYKRLHKMKRKYY
jgi:GGDEF domain-containing protein